LELLAYAGLKFGRDALRVHGGFEAAAESGAGLHLGSTGRAGIEMPLHPIVRLIGKL
jgi:hypothetical protein